jgi:hypothetical protein
MSVLQNVFPNDVSVSLYNRVSTHFQRFFREYSWVDATDDNCCAALLCLAHNPITRPAISSVNSDTNDIAWTYHVGIKGGNGLVDNDRITREFDWRCARNDK